MDPYQILGVPKDASKSAIKKAYRKLAMEHHPDQGGTEDRFKQINEAYSILSNEDKKNQYDAMKDGVNINDFLRNFAGGFGGFNPSKFAEIFGIRHKKKKIIKETQDHEITFKFKISLDDVKKGIQKTGTYRRYINCNSCKSEGGKGRQECRGCNGTGMKMMQMTPNIVQNMPCDTCTGRGATFDNICKTCNGNGL